MKFRHALIMTALKLVGFHVFTTLKGYHFILGPRQSLISKAIYIEEL
ncbi:hypothetical protein ES707_18745 [subsurface metagenome]